MFTLMGDYCDPVIQFGELSQAIEFGVGTLKRFGNPGQSIVVKENGNRVGVIEHTGEAIVWKGDTHNVR